MTQQNTAIPKISCMTLTNRYGGLDIGYANVKRQDFSDWEWVVIDALYDYRHKEFEEYVKGDPRVRHIKQNPMVEGTFTNLAHADNQGFRECRGELIVCVQDYIYIPFDGFSKYWFHHKEHPEGILVTGVGHQYSKPSKEDMVDEKG